jgi:hypothetical protein
MDWTRMSGAEEELILNLHQEGFNPGQIAAILWSEYKIARRSKTIENAIKRLKVQGSRKTEH